MVANGSGRRDSRLPGPKARSHTARTDCSLRLSWTTSDVSLSTSLEHSPDGAPIATQPSGSMSPTT